MSSPVPVEVSSLSLSDADVAAGGPYLVAVWVARVLHDVNDAPKGRGREID